MNEHSIGYRNDFSGHHAKDKFSMSRTKNPEKGDLTEIVLTPKTYLRSYIFYHYIVMHIKLF